VRRLEEPLLRQPRDRAAPGVGREHRVGKEA
jgi:hypothetical protein